MTWKFFLMLILFPKDRDEERGSNFKAHWWWWTGRHEGYARSYSADPVVQTVSLGCFLGKSPQLVSPGKINNIRTKASATADSMALELSPSKTAVCSQRIHCHCVRASMAEGIWGKREACLDRLERLACLIKQSLLKLVLCKTLAYLLITWETHL